MQKPAMILFLVLILFALFIDLLSGRVQFQRMAEAAITRYWCHECEQAIEEAMAEEIKCPFCDSGFIEEMIGEEFEGLTSQHSEQSSSQWGTLDNPFEEPGAARDNDEEEEEDDDDMGREFEGFIRRHRRASALRRVLGSIQDDLRADRERDNSILINAFNQALALQGSVLDTDEDRGDQGGSGNDGLLEEYVLGAGLSLLLQHLAENDPNRYGTLPAKKEVVEALPLVKIEDVVSCSVCLDDLELGSQAKQMPCEHKFHSPCILPWLELHSSCPVCRFELPTEETKYLNEHSNINRTDSVHEEVRADGPGNGGESNNRTWALVPWFNGLFSTPDTQTARGAFTDQQPPSPSGTNLNAGES
ncbi:E3 ubiquitin-protein ligase SIRP1-like isoform X2 [Phragmites australis]|uniref:E3 ubiquitin-protein ligase SIRP1-like isoform X2 n=1 Tax=Phragmites australis TaxID=29695 RepID=UPI002D77AA67|nr:E3 ubiquitin-protein ligase SIRP1-like isoform X2 [Phragmites australis]